MNKAEWYASLFRTGQYGRFYVVSFPNVKGKMFSIQILPKEEKAYVSHIDDLCTNSNAVLVYGVIGKIPDWKYRKVKYGWIHKGKWIEDFEKLAKKRQEEKEKDEELELHRQVESEIEREIKMEIALENYKKGR